MNIILTPEQSQIVEQKLQSGRYQNMDDLFIQAFQLLDDWEEHSLTESPDWIVTTRTKVDAAISSLAANGGFIILYKVSNNDEEIGIEIL
jgi:antitoxin ParD1/3/4